MVVQGNLENLGKHLAAEDPLRRYVDRATQGAARGATLVQHLLAFARRQNLFPAQLDLAERMAEAVELLRGAVGHAIVLDWRPEPDLWPVETDATQLETALLNLAVNARDAMPLGGRLEVAAENVRVTEPVSTVDGHGDPGEYVRIRVSDSGAGMSQEVRDSAFEPFFTTKPVGKGTGLGLSQVYGFVKQSRGHVGIDSAPGRGTTVTLWLPRAVPALGGSTRATAPASSPWPG